MAEHGSDVTPGTGEPFARDLEAPPPNYTTSDDSQPPSYDSVFGKIKEAREKSDGNVEFGKTACSILAGSIGFTIILAITLALPIAMIVIGAINLKGCPRQRLIPIWLIVAGSVAAFQQVISLLRRMCSKREDEESEDGNASKGGNGCVGLFQFCWFICGNVWVYGIYAPSNTSDPSLDTYCDATTYYLAFWVITAAYIMMGLAILCCCGCCACLGCGAKKQ